jgi:hypothetical protein
MTPEEIEKESLRIAQANGAAAMQLCVLKWLKANAGVLASKSLDELILVMEAKHAAVSAGEELL